MHPLLQKSKQELADKGHVVREEVRNPQQIKKHRKEQKKFAEDRHRGAEMKKIRTKMTKGWCEGWVVALR